MEELLSSGFEAMSQNRPQSALEQPTGLVIKNGTTGQLIASLSVPVKNTSIYEGRASKDGGSTWPQTVFTGDSQHVIFDGLTAGTTYTIQVRALGPPASGGRCSEIRGQTTEIRRQKLETARKMGVAR